MPLMNLIKNGYYLNVGIHFLRDFKGNIQCQTRSIVAHRVSKYKQLNHNNQSTIQLLWGFGVLGFCGFSS